MTKPTATIPGVSIDRSTAEDMPVIQALLAESQLPVINSNDESVHFYVARRNGIVIGCLGWESYDSVALLRSFAVSEGLRGAGIGSLLLQEALSCLVHEGFSAFYLLTESASDFAIRFGFSNCDRSSAPDAIKSTKQFASQCASTAQFMRMAANR